MSYFSRLLQSAKTASRFDAGNSPALSKEFLWLSTGIFVWYLVNYVFLPIAGVGLGIEESWRAFLTWAFEHDKQFGTDVIFTYGPWGFLLDPRGTMQVYPWQIAGRLVLAMAASSGIALLGVSWIRSGLARWIWAGVIVLFAETSLLMPVLLFLGTMPSVAEFRWKRAVLFLIAFATGLAACTKFTSFLLVASLLPLMLVRRSLALLVPTTVGSFFLFWLIAGQRASNLPAFIGQSMEVSSGYASAMVSDRPSLELALALAICGLPLLLLAGKTIPPVDWLAGQPSDAWSTQASNSAGLPKRERSALPGCYSIAQRARPRAARPTRNPLNMSAVRFIPRRFCAGSSIEKLGRLGWLSVCEFLIFRHSVIRADPRHLHMALINIGIPIAILISSSPSVAFRAWPSHWKAVYGLLFVEAVAGTLLLARGSIIYSAHIFLESFRLYPLYARELPSGRFRDRAVSAGTASVDVFPDELSYAIQKGLPLQNRPVIQSYTAYTENLCKKNAAFLEGPNAPQTIYFRSYGIDKRYPTMEDTLAWRSLLTHYAASSISDGFLVLKRREQPLTYRLNPLLDRIVRTDQPLAIPSVPGGLVWAEIQLPQTLTGRLLNLLYRKEKMVLRVMTTRRSLDFTLVDETTGAGFLLSPFVSNQPVMFEIFQPESDRSTAENVRSILVHGGKMASIGFSRNFRVRLYALVLDSAAHEVPTLPIQDLGRTLLSERPVGSVDFSPVLEVMGAEERLVVGSSSSGWIARQAGKTIRLRYGVEGERSTCSGGVSYKILTGSDTMKGKSLLWQVTRQSVAGKDWSAESTVALPSADYSRLYFETASPDRSCGAEGAYWSDLRIQP